MLARRSRLGCEECRRRRRKCDEGQPKCGPCSTFDRNCNYQLKVVLSTPKTSHEEIETKRYEAPGTASTTIALPRNLPNGISLPSRYRRLLRYFTDDILASLSVHPSIHADLRRGLVPVALESPHLLSACLALAAAGFKSRGVKDIDGTDISRVLDHLQSSGLSLLRSTLGSGQSSTALLVTCLIWCLADVFAAGQGTTSWRVHLRGIKALISTNATYRRFQSDEKGDMTAMRHLHQLYLALETLPYVPALDLIEVQPVSEGQDQAIGAAPCIDGFLGYSEELLYVLRDVDRIATNAGTIDPEADALLDKVHRMIDRDEEAAPTVLINTPLSPEQANEFLLCHKAFQQATLVHLYRRLQRLPSSSVVIREAIGKMEVMIDAMTQDQSCHTWVAMAMPLFTMGCEAFTSEQKGFVLEKIARLDACLGSLHVGIMRKALEDMWRIRNDLKDTGGQHCASELLGKFLVHSFIPPASIANTSRREARVQYHLVLGRCKHSSPLQFVITAANHLAEGALLDHDAHNLVKDISGSHRGVLGVGIICGLSYCQQVPCELGKIYLQQPQRYQQQSGSLPPGRG